MTLLFKPTTSDFKAAEQNLNWQVITRCFRPVVSFHDALLATVTCLHSSLPDSSGRDMGESLEIWTEIPACPALLSGECSTIQTKGVGLGGGRVEWERMGGADKSLSDHHPPTLQHTATRFTTSLLVYEIIKHVPCLVSAMR